MEEISYEIYFDAGNSALSFLTCNSLVTTLKSFRECNEDFFLYYTVV
jgi:hypothetical protein